MMQGLVFTRFRFVNRGRASRFREVPLEPARGDALTGMG